MEQKDVNESIKQQNEGDNAQQKVELNPQQNVVQNTPQYAEQDMKQYEYRNFNYGQGQNMNPPNQPMETQTTKILSQSGIALFIIGIAILLLQSIIGTIVAASFPEVEESNWYIWALTAFTMIGVALPLFYLLTKRIPDSPKGEVVRLKVSHFIVIFLICTAAMYITNFFSVFLTFLISLIKGDGFMDLNPLTDIFANSNFVISLLYAAVAAPIIEELIFRKLLLDKLRRYGDVPAILLTGLAFGLFHMNISQFFYASVLGFIFAYVTIRTNTVRYSIVLHILINFIGTAITPLAVSGNMIFSYLILLWVFSAITVGVILFILNFKKINLQKTAQPLQKKSSYLFNTGVVLYTIMCLVMIVISTVA
jgi:membrane protease YdiL (CAAX protease family)